MIVGPGVGGLLASGPRSYLDVTLCGIALSAITLLCIHIFLQESLSPERRKPKKRHSILSTFRLIKRYDAEPAKNHQKLIHRASALQQHDGIIHCDYRVVYYRSLSLFIKTLGMFMFFVGLFLAFNQAVVSKWMVKKTNELFTLKVGLALSASGMIAITQTDTLWLYICFYYLLNLGVSLTVPTFHALVAQHAGSEDTGEIMGIGDAIISLSNAVFPILAASAYAVLGASFFQLIAVLPIIALFIALKTIAPVR